MTTRPSTRMDGGPMPPWWQWTMLAFATLVLCSCSAPAKRHGPSMQPANCPPEAACGPEGCGPQDGGPQQFGPQQACAPMGQPYTPFPGEMGGMLCGGGPIPCDWQGQCGGDCRRACPPDEYLFDGGDRAESVGVRADFTVDGLNPEDTVAHYDTLQGDTLVVPSNCVPIYSPRFAAVRVVHSPNIDLQIDALKGQDVQLPPLLVEASKTPAHSKQHEQLGRNDGRLKPSGVRVREFGEVASQNLLPREASDRIKAFEDLAIIRYGIHQQNEKPRLAQAAQAAYTWTRDQAVQVSINGQSAQAVDEAQKVEVTYTVDTPGKPKLRIIKIADKQLAEPGEIVEFTLRFDNVGTQVMGNVTILDSLTTRLEFIPDSAHSSVKTADYERDETGKLVLEEIEVERSPIDGGPVERVKAAVPKRKQNPVKFSTSVNNVDSLVLRWEVQDPLEPGQGGVLRFKCRVR